MNRIIRGFFCALMLCVLLADTTLAQEELSLYATSAVLMDADSGRVLYARNADAVLAMASTTKIMTCIIVLEYGDLEEELTVSAYAASMPKVKLYLKQGERYRVRDLLYSLMLESHNDSAVALAEHIGRKYTGTDLGAKDAADYTAEESKQAVAAFAKLMNQKAAELECRNTYFITPNGLDATETVTDDSGESVQKEHSTTATELARIMSYCILQSPKKEEFLTITGEASYSFSANGRSYSCNNHNAFLSMMEGALSGKTGFTNKAGYCYVGALQRDGRTFVVALLACGWPNNKSYKWSDTRALMEYGLDSYFFRSFLEEGIAFDETRLQPIPVSNGQTEILGSIAYTQVAIGGRQGNGQGDAPPGLLLREDERIQVEYRMEQSLEAPVTSGTLVGSIYYVVDDEIYWNEYIYTTSDVDKIDFKWCFLQIWERFQL